MTEKPKIIITGAAGLLGQALLAKFASEYQVTAVIHNNTIDNADHGIVIEKSDLCERSAVTNLIRRYEPEIIVNAAAWVDVDGCESDRKRALKSNYCIVENLITAGRPGNVFFIQISTDYIFNGVGHPAGIDDSPAPLNYYGRSKLMAEEYICDNYANYLITRTCALIGSPNQGQTNLINYFYDSLKAGAEIDAPDDQYSNPIWVKNLAELIEEAVHRRFKGIVHLGGRDYLSRYQFAKEFAEVFGFDDSLIKPVVSVFQNRPAKRPQYAGLNVEQTIEKFETPILPLRHSLSSIKASL